MSVLRPPTPEPEKPKEPTPAELIRAQLTDSGERERLKGLLCNRLEECGWKDEVRALARGAPHPSARPLVLARPRPPHTAPPAGAAELMRGRPEGGLTVDELVRALKPRGRAAVPDAVKAELLAALRAAIA
jgi:enhancer of yellow 2 transcription factor